MQRDPRSRVSFSFSLELKNGQRTISLSLWELLATVLEARVVICPSFFYLFS